MQEIPYDASHVPIDYDAPVDHVRGDETRLRRESRASLEKDVAQLQKKLMVEVNMRNALNRGLNRPMGALPRIYASLPVETRELLLEVAVLEEEIISLEKQVMHLGKEIENGAPVTDKEMICLSPHQLLSPKKANMVGSPAVSPKDSSRINSKPSVSPRQFSDQKSNLSKSSLPPGKITENKNSPKKVAISPRKSVDDDNPVKSPQAVKDSSKPARRITIIVPPQKSQTQSNSLVPKAHLRNSRDSKSRRLSFTKKEAQGFPSTVKNTEPFVPKNLSIPKDGIASSPPISPATGGSTDVGKRFSRPPRLKTENDKPPTIGQAQLRGKESLSDKVAITARTLGPTEKDKSLVDTARRTPRLPRQPLKHGTVVTKRTMGATTASKQQSTDSNKTCSTPDSGSKLRDCNLDATVEHRNPADAEVAEHDQGIADLSSSDMLDADQSSNHLPSGPVKATESVMLSEEVVMLLKTIYGNLQEKQPPLACDSGSSSQTSMSASVSSASPDDYEMRRGSKIELKLDGCHSEGFRTNRSASLRFMGDCYPNEVADILDPYSYSNRGSINNRLGFHERLMS